MNQPGNDREDQRIFLWFAFLIIAFCIVPLLYTAHLDVVNGPLLTLAKAQLKAFTPFFEEAENAFARIAAADPASLSWDTMQKVLRYTGSWIRWPFLLLLVLFGVASIFMGRVGGLVRRFNMESLLKNNAESFPCLRPVVGRGKYLLSRDSYDAGPWKVARTPVQFALENGLLLDEAGKTIKPEQALLKNGMASMSRPAWGNARLDEQKSLAVLKKQLGKRFKGHKSLSPCRRALAAALLAYAGGDKKACLAILDAISTSYQEEKGQPSCPLLTSRGFVNKLNWKKHKKRLSENCLTRHSAYELPWFMALLYRARQKGVLASSQFLWLRPLDRPLWYALNQCGGRAAWAEGFAAWAHYQAEEKAGKALSEPHVQPAVASLRQSLAAQGWLTEIFVPPTPESTSAPTADTAETSTLDSEFSPVEQPPDVVLADAEDNPEYNANEDEKLADEYF